MVIVSKGAVEHANTIKSALIASGLIMGTPQTNFSMNVSSAVNNNNNTTNNGTNSNTIVNNIESTATITTITPQCASNRVNDIQEQPTAARCILTCQPNSHPFQTRTLYLEPNIEVKVGRSIAKFRVSEYNAVFDCKVLSRNHAVIWYSDGKFYVKDTRSSNGTFINERRLSHSEPEELSSGDIVKFGVDVLENARKEVHGCIIACVKLFLPDGREAISRASSGNTGLIQNPITFDELYRLHHYIQETSQREKMLEIKMHDIQKVIEVTRHNASSCWQSMIDEDRLLNQIETLETKLKFLQKNAPNNELKEEILKLQEDRNLYQQSAKEALYKAHQERLEAIQKLTAIERALCTSEDECSLLRDQLLRAQQNIQEISNRATRFENECKEYRTNNEKVQNEVQKNDTEIQQLHQQLKRKENELAELKNQISSLMVEKKFLQRRLEHFGIKENVNDDETSETSSNRGTVKKWLENSDLNHREGSADIIKAICEDTDYDDENIEILPEFQQIQQNLYSVEKKLLQLSSHLSNDQSNLEINGDDTSVKITATINDGNQNIQSNEQIIEPQEQEQQQQQPQQQLQQQQQQEVDQLQNSNTFNYNDTIKTNITTLMEICNEVNEYLSAVKSTKLFNKMQDDYKKLESKLTEAELEIANLRIESELRQTQNNIQEKLELNEYLENQLHLRYKKLPKLEENIAELKIENELLKKDLQKYKNNENYNKINNENKENYSVTGKCVDIAIGTMDNEDIIDNVNVKEDGDNNVDNDDDDGDDESVTEKADTDEECLSTKKSSNLNAMKNCAFITTDEKKLLTLSLMSPPPSSSSSPSTTTTTLNATYPVSKQKQHNENYEFNDTNSINDSIQIDNTTTSIEDDISLINNPEIQREEELILFKEKCDYLLQENLILRNSINELHADVENIRSRYLTKFFMYGTLIVAILSYIVSYFK